MNPLLLGALVGGGMGVLQGQENQKNFREEQRLNAVKAMYSPWLGIHPTNPQRPSTFGPIMQGAFTGAAMGQMLPADLFGGSASKTHQIAPTIQNAILDEHGGPTLTADTALYAHQTRQPPMVAVRQQDFSPWDYRTQGHY